MGAIYKKEMRSAFHSLAAYLYLALYTAASGIYFSIICLSYGYTDYSRYVFGNITILYIVIVPILTMRLFAEERKQRTEQLLYSAPIRTRDIVLGKYLSVLTLLSLSILISLAEAAVLSSFGPVNWNTILTGCLGYFLLGACLLAVGEFLSSLTDNQMVAAAMSFGFVLLCMLLPNIVDFVPSRPRYTFIVCALAALGLGLFVYDRTKDKKTGAAFGLAGLFLAIIPGLINKELYQDGLARILTWISVTDRFEDFISGILNGSSIVYYISFAVLFLFLTVQHLERRR